MRYDPAVVDAVACNIDPDGVFDAEVCNPDFDNDGVNPDIVCFTIASVAGVSGDLLLAEITFQAVGQVGDTSVLDVVIETLTDPGGAPMPVSDQDGELTITPCPDFVDPPGMGVGDIQYVVARWPELAVGQPYDLDRNGVINIVDIMKVAAAWGPCP